MTTLPATHTILVFNAGSSSLNYKLYRAAGDELSPLAWGKAHRVGVTGDEAPFLEHHTSQGSERTPARLPDHASAARLALSRLRADDLPIDAIGHRFVHGGERFSGPALLTKDTLAGLRACLPLAPIHNPNSLSVIEVCLDALPGLPQYAVFDTAFHAGLPPEAVTYALPGELRRELGLRKYGFHGLSYEHIRRAAPALLGRAPEGLRLIACHLGTGGSSAAAMLGGQPVETSMGYSPLEGLVMSTRCGSLDPQIPLLLVERGYSPAEVERILNHKSGLLGLSGVSSDLRDIIRRAEAGDPNCQLAYDVYAHRLTLTVGAFAAALGGLDALVFTDDVGMQCWQLRQRVCARLAYLGLRLDEAANRAAPSNTASRLESPGSPVAVLAIPADEERVVAQAGLTLLQ